MIAVISSGDAGVKKKETD